jgi:hypothetical protein
LNEDSVGIGDFLENFYTNGTLPSNDERIIKWRDEEEILILRDLQTYRFSFVEVFAEYTDIDQVTTEALDTIDLDAGGANGHDNDGLNFEMGTREGDSLCMVAWNASGGGREYKYTY